MVVYVGVVVLWLHHGGYAVLPKGINPERSEEK
jgi:hypothetical protein